MLICRQLGDRVGRPRGRACLTNGDFEHATGTLDLVTFFKVRYSPRTTEPMDSLRSRPGRSYRLRRPAFHQLQLPTSNAGDAVTDLQDRADFVNATLAP